MSVEHFSEMNQLLEGLEPDPFAWDKSDYQKAQWIADIVKMPGWKVLLAGLNMQREAFDKEWQLLPSGHPDKYSPNASLARECRKRGFDIACNHVYKILAEVDRRLKLDDSRKRLEKQAQHLTEGA